MGSPQSGFFQTVDWQASADALLLSLGLLLLAFLTVVLVRSKRRALQLLFALVLAGLAQAIYGSLMMLSGMEWGFFAPKEFGRGLATGTFINRNHYANLLVLSLSAGIGLLLAQMDLAGAPTMRARLRSLLQATLGPKARLRIFLVVIVIALVLTRSRGGNTAFFAALTMVGLFALWRLRQRSRPLVVLVVSVLIIDVFVIGTWFGVEQVIDRIQRSVQVQEDGWVVQDQNRIDADRESLDIISRRPVQGWGGGTFYTVYPAWRGDDQMFMDHAHNDYLEFAVDHGLVGLALLGWFVLLCVLRAARGLQDRDESRLFGVSFASLMAITAMMIHAAVDFSLQIPANAAWFVVLALLPFAVADSGRGGRPGRGRHPDRVRRVQ
jgi:O-antigen ligase